MKNVQLLKDPQRILSSVEVQTTCPQNHYRNSIIRQMCIRFPNFLYIRFLISIRKTRNIARQVWYRLLTTPCN